MNNKTNNESDRQEKTTMHQLKIGISKKALGICLLLEVIRKQLKTIRAETSSKKDTPSRPGLSDTNANPITDIP